MVHGLRALPWLVGRPHGPDDLRQVSSKHLRTVHLAILFRLFPLTLADDRVAVIAPAPHAPKLYFHCADCGSYSQTPTVSRETAVYGHLFRKYWADPLLCRRSTLSIPILPLLASSLLRTTNRRQSHHCRRVASSIINPATLPATCFVIANSVPQTPSRELYVSHLSLSTEPPRLRYLNIPHRPR